jgi:acyl-CoA hydrolase
MKHKIEKIPYNIFKDYELTDIQSKSGKHNLIFYNFEILPCKKIIVSFFGDIFASENITNNKVTSIAINNFVGMQMHHKLLNFTQIKNGVEIKPIKESDIFSFQELIFFFGEEELKCAVKNLVIEEVDDKEITFRSRKMVMPGDLNGANTLFGGRILSWVDEESAIFAACQLGTHRLVTAGMSAIDFTSPALQNNIVEIGCRVVRFGETSLTLKCVVRNKDTKRNILVVEEITFVSLDKDGYPTPHGKTIETKD